MILAFDQALEVLRKEISQVSIRPVVETLPLAQALGRILAEDLAADRDYPPFARSARDGFAVRSADTASAPVTLHLIGEARAGSYFEGSVGPGECVSIMTGAPLPEGADSVVMVEHTQAEGAAITLLRPAAALDNISPRGSETKAGRKVLARGKTIGPGEIGLMASIGATEAHVFQQPEVAILPTGDELVPIEAAPRWFEVRNSNSASLAAQVRLAGGVARPLPVARDSEEQLKRLILDGLGSDLLLLSGGVSAGKYDLVEKVLEELGAEFYFTGVAIRPGKPLVFGRVREKFFFGLPGNPISTYVTFQIFARPIVRALGGAPFDSPLFLGARLTRAVKRREGLTAFIPALAARENGAPVVAPVEWEGSGDVAGFPAANCFLVIHPDREPPAAGDWMDVLLKM